MFSFVQAEKVQERRITRGEDAKVNMLILMSDTGGGHRASAQALEAALEDMFPGRIAVTMVDIFTEHSRWPYSASVPAYQVRRGDTGVVVVGGGGGGGGCGGAR